LCLHWARDWAAAVHPAQPAGWESRGLKSQPHESSIRILKKNGETSILATNVALFQHRPKSFPSPTTLRGNRFLDLRKKEKKKKKKKKKKGPLTSALNKKKNYTHAKKLRKPATITGPPAQSYEQSPPRERPGRDLSWSRP